MARNSFDRLPRKGDFILVRHEHNDPQLFLVWRRIRDRGGATRNNVLVINANLVVQYPDSTIQAVEFRNRVRDARTVERAVAIFTEEIDSGFYDPSHHFFQVEADPLADHMDDSSTFFFRPHSSAIQKVLLGDRCVNQHCRDGFISAENRAETYRQYALRIGPDHIWHGDRQNIAMQCPACLPRRTVEAYENAILSALYLDSGRGWQNRDLKLLREHEGQINDARLEAGYEPLKLCPELVWVVGCGHSGWFSQWPEGWLEETGLSRQANRALQREIAENPAALALAADTSQSTTTTATTDRVVTRTYARFQHAADGVQCCICLDELKDGDKVVILSCVHFFHEACIAPWFRRRHSCPLCQRRVSRRRSTVAS